MSAVAEKRLSNSEQQLLRIAEEEAEREEPSGILELFDRDEDAPLARDDSDE